MMTRYAMGSYQRASGTRDAFAALSAALVAEGFPEITVNSGDREPENQEAIFRSKFVPSSGPKDVGPYNDRRLWPGNGYWKRVVGGGTVGVPGTSNHEKRRAADLAYPYNSNTAAHRRAQILAPRFNITCEGMGFSEWWHWTFWGPLGAIDSSTGSGAGAVEGDMPFNKDDILVLNGMGQSIKDDVIKALKADIASVHNTVIGGVNTIRADLNTLHVASPVSLKRIFEAQTGAAVTFTDEQLEAISDRLSAGAVASIDAALRDDFEGVKARLAQLPAETIAALKAAL